VCLEFVPGPTLVLYVGNCPQRNGKLGRSRRLGRDLTVVVKTQIVNSPPGINISLDARVGNMESNINALQSSIDLLTKSFLAAQGLKVAGGVLAGCHLSKLTMYTG